MSLRTFSRTALLSFVLATAQIAAMHGVFATTGSPEDWKAQHTVSNGAYRLDVSVRDGQVFVRLRDLAMGLELSNDAYVYRASCPVETGTMISERLTDPAITVAEQTIKVTGQLAGLRIEHAFTLPADKPYMEERIVLRNETGTPISMSDFEAGFQRRIATEMGHVPGYLELDRIVAIPFRHRATDPEDYNRDFSMVDLLIFAGSEHRAAGTVIVRDLPSRHRYSEGWAWTHEDHTLGIFKFNQEAIEFSMISTLLRDDGVALRFGGAVMLNGDPSSLTQMDPGEEVALGVTRYQTVKGDATQANYAFRALLDENGCRFPDDYDPPVHWNELYDNPEWHLMTPGKPESPRMTRPLTYTRELIELEAAKARDYSCESLYLDPGWDTNLGTFIWGKEWLGPRDEFVRDMKDKYGLGVSLHCPLATWLSFDGRGVATWPEASFHMDASGSIVKNSVCLGSQQYLDEAERRLLEHCADGIVFLMFDGNWYNAGCWNPAHGHPVPYTLEAHCRANLDLAQRIHAKYPDVLIEMHHMITGGSMNRYAPIYYKYGLPGSYDDNWGFELMWNCMEDIRTGRALALYYHNLGCNVPIYLHVDLRDDNEHCLVLWWNASTCRHLGIGGTHENPQIAEAQRLAMQRYRSLDRFYKRGDFYGISEEIHLHVLPDEGAFVVNLFNLSDEPRRIAGEISVDLLGLDPDQYYIASKGCGFRRRQFYVDRLLEPWSAQVAEVRVVAKDYKRPAPVVDLPVTARGETALTIAGTWQVDVQIFEGVVTANLVVGENMAAKMVMADAEFPVVDFRLAGHRLTFSGTTKYQFTDVDYDFEGTVDGDQIEGVFHTPLGDAPATGTRKTQ